MIGPCSRCGAPTNKKSHAWCRTCRSAYDKEWYSKNKESRCENMKARHRKNPLIHMVSAAKKRAKEKGLEFSITKDDLVIPSFCPILGIEISVNDRRWQDSSPTIDRLYPEIGYVKGNVAVVSARANRIKNDATPDELEKIAAYVRNQGK